MEKYNLGFISDNQIFEHVKTTVDKYRFGMTLAEFTKNILDPIKLTFDTKVYRQTIEDVLKGEVIRQLDKSNTNHIGYFHQNIFKYFGNGWDVPERGYDVINTEKHIYVEIKNKHNTMNSSSSQKTYMRMLNTINTNKKAVCLLVEVIAKGSHDAIWKVSLDNESISNPQIRRVSMDKFYEMATGDSQAFKKLCQALPKIIDDVVVAMTASEKTNTVLVELQKINPDILKSLYLLSFKKYEGFNDFSFS